MSPPKPATPIRRTCSPPSPGRSTSNCGSWKRMFRTVTKSWHLLMSARGDQSAMSHHRTETTAAGDAIAPAADAITKCPPLVDLHQRDGMSIGFAEASKTGDVPTIVSNDRGLYE